MMKIERNIYLQKLTRKMGNGLVKVITGIRRCGKSYLLFKLFYEHLLNSGISENHIISLALDDRSYKALRNPDAILAYIKERITDRQPYYIMLDEVQYLPEFEEVLNSLLHIPNADVYVTGSNSKFLSSDVITEFRGRGDEIRVHPLCFREFLSVHDGSEDKAWEDYLYYGGLPLVLSMFTPEEKAEYLNGLFNMVYLSDLKERHRIKNSAELDELTDILASSVGSLTNPLKLAKTMRSVKNKTVSDKTLKSYIDYLLDSFLISKAVRFDIKGRKYIGSPAKYYFEDVGLRNARLHFRQMEENHLMENIIYNELRIRGYQVDVGVVEKQIKTETGALKQKQFEIDFVASRGSEKYYIQSAFAQPSSEKAEQEERPLRAVNDSFKKIIVVRDHIGLRRNETGIVTMGLRLFLKEERSLEF